MTKPSKQRFSGPIALALSLSLTTSGAMAAPGDTNSINNGRDVVGGTYYNTADNKTTFINNRGADGLVVGPSQTVRGLEVNGAGLPTGNGGTLHFYAPGSMVRLDGNVDVSGLLRNGSYIGNGGRVFVDAAMLFQNGTIFANGVNGGTVQFNVGSAMFGPASRVEAQGFGGLAGTISVNAIGAVDLQNGAIFDASGRSVNTLNAPGNVNVNVVASLVNNEGIIRANAVNVSDGHIALLGGNTSLAASEAADAARAVGVTPTVPADSGLNGGVIRLVANGQTRTDCVECVADKAQAEGIITADEATTIKDRQSVLVTGNEGNLVNTGLIQANGGNNGNTLTPELGLNGGDGGKIIATAANSIINTGTIEARGGNGANYFNIDNLTQAPGTGGTGGTVALSALNDIINGSTGLINVNGGTGGASSTNGSSTSGFNLQLTNTSNVDTPAVPDQQTANGVFSADTAINGGVRAGNGGTGGLATFSYGRSLLNDGVVSANGGTGGQGLAVQVDTLADAGARQAAQAIATAVGGAGGLGGNGGLIVLSGPSNPTGSGRFEANGGTGGAGGNATARAAALAIGSGYSDFEENATATATASGGQGGIGGQAGQIYTPDPATATFNYSRANGAGGNAGRGVAEARSLAVDAGFAQASSQGVVGSEAYALGTTINIPNVNPVTDFSAGSPASLIRDAFQSRTIYSLDRAGTESLTAPFGTLGLGSSESRQTTLPPSAFSDGIVPVVSGINPGPGNSPSIDFAGSSANVTLVNPTPQGPNQPLLQTPDNMLAANGDTVVLLSQGGSQPLLTERLNDGLNNGTFRWINQPNDLAIRHVLVSDVSGNALTLDKPSGQLNGVFDGLTSLSVNHLGGTTDDGGVITNGLTVPDGAQWSVGRVSNGVTDSLASGGGHASFITRGDLNSLGSATITAWGTNTGGSISLTGNNVLTASSRTDLSATEIATNAGNTAFHGGAISIKGADTVWNDPGINVDNDVSITANGNVLGGTVRLQAGVLLANNGVITANGQQQGGSIIGKAGVAAVNQQLLSANGGQQGGYVRWHGNALALNGADLPSQQNQVGYAGRISATGGQTGGVIKLTSGGIVPPEFTDVDLDLTTLNLLPNQAGFGVTQGTLTPAGVVNTSLLSALPNVLPLGSAINAGQLDARGADVGAVDIAGDGLAFNTTSNRLSATSINGVTSSTDPGAFFANANSANVRFIAGNGAVRAAVCDQPLTQNPGNPETPVTPPGTPGNPINTPDNNQPNQDFTAALLQNQRPYLQDRLPVPTNNKLVLRLGQPGLFLATAYSPITQEILNLALREYNREIANGQAVAEASRLTQLYLKQSGVDNEIASQLIEQIEAGAYQADKRVLTVLQTIANQPSEEPTENGIPIRQ